MSDMDTLNLELGERSYQIHVGSNLIASAGELISPVLRQSRAIIVTDENVAPLYLEPLTNSLNAADIASESIVLPAGEQTKSFDQFNVLLETILDLKIERGTALIALGGGVIGDLTGFAAATLLRGIDFIQVPTTVLAQVDSSVGGKTGINTRHGKNLVGAFYQPRLVIADIDTLDTLDQRQVLAGYAEVVKYGLINDPAFFDWLEENGEALCAGNKDHRKRAVMTSCRSKAEIVSADERESNVRALLNLGHTFGHALEAETGFSDTLLHGEAVAIGIALAFDLSARMGLCDASDAQRVRRHYQAVGLRMAPTDVDGVSWDTDALIRHMASDKKVRDGQVTFVLAKGIGQAFIAGDVTMDDVRRVVDQAITA